MAEEEHVPDIVHLAPVTEQDYARVLDFIESSRDGWIAALNLGFRELGSHLDNSGYEDVEISCRLKDTEAILAKMRRFGEPLRVMLDVWGYRVVVLDEHQLDSVAVCCRKLWQTPTPDELLLRHGQLQFEPWRDYRLRNHAGLSAATSDRYDHAIHMNRRAPFGIVEIQVMTLELWRRVHGDTAAEDSHEQYAIRRERLFRR